MAHSNNNFKVETYDRNEKFYNYTRTDPTGFGGADFKVRNVEEHPRDYLESSRIRVPRSGIQDIAKRGESQQSEPGPHRPSKTTEKDFEQLGKLGSGSFGKVMLVRKRKGENKNKLFAMKVSKKPKGYELANREKYALMKCKHPFIVSLFYAFQTASEFCLVLEYVPCGDLMTYIERQNMPEDYARFYSAEIILAVKYLHGLSIMHRDLKPDNVLICVDGHIKLADFGLCTHLKQSSRYRICGTRGYMAPEMFVEKHAWRAIYGKAVDWWSMGALIYHMLLGQIPFKKFKHQDTEYLHHVMTVHLMDDRMFAARLTREAQDLITQLLAVDASARLKEGPEDAVSIKNHEFFRSINWDDVLRKKCQPPIKFQNSETDPSAFFPDFCRQMSDDDPNVKACDYDFKGFSYVAPSNFDGLPEESGSCRGEQPRPAQVPSRMINHCPTEAIHPIQVVRDHTASSPKFDAHQQAKAYPAMSNTPQIFPSPLSYNAYFPISDPVKESHRQRYARMDYTPVAPMFDHHNLVTPRPGFNMVQNPLPEYDNTQQFFPSNLSYNPHISDPIKESHRQRYARMDYTPVAPMYDHHNLVPPPPGFNMVQNPLSEYYNTQQFLPSNFSYNLNLPISDPAKDSHGQRYARMDYTPVAPMFGHPNLVPPPPGLNMVQNPPSTALFWGGLPTSS